MDTHSRKWLSRVLSDTGGLSSIHHPNTHETAQELILVTPRLATVSHCVALCDVIERRSLRQFFFLELLDSAGALSVSQQFRIKGSEDAEAALFFLRFLRNVVELLHNIWFSGRLNRQNTFVALLPHFLHNNTLLTCCLCGETYSPYFYY